MPQRMRVDAFLPECRYDRSGGDQMLAKQVVHPKAGELVAAIIDKQCRGCINRVRAFFDESLQQPGSLRPDWTHADLVSFALESYLARPLHA